MALQLTHINVAAFQNYNESLNAQGELVITAVYNGQTLVQTVPIPVLPVFVLFDPSNLNFYAMQDVSQAVPGMQLVESILAVA